VTFTDKTCMKVLKLLHTAVEHVAQLSQRDRTTHELLRFAKL